MNTNKLFSTSFNWDNRETILNELSHKNKVRFALFCAKQTRHLTDNKEAMQAINIVELFLEDKATAKKCRKASDAASYAAYTSYDAAAATAATAAATASYATSNTASNTTTTASVSYAAANASAYAVSASASAAEAAFYAAINPNDEPNKDQLKQEQMDYLRDLAISELSEEERDNWLLIATL